MTEFCRILKQRSAQKIDVWCCARASITQPVVISKAPVPSQNSIFR